MPTGPNCSASPDSMMQYTYLPRLTGPDCGAADARARGVALAAGRRTAARRATGVFFRAALAVVLGMLPAPTGILRRPRRRGEDVPDFRHQIVRQTGFGDQRVAPGLLRRVRDARERMARERDDGNRRRARIRLETPRRFPTVHDGQRQVHQDDVWRRILGALERLEAVPRFDDVEA